MRAVDGSDRRTLLGVAAALESASEHPLAAAFLAAAKTRRCLPPLLREFAAIRRGALRALSTGSRSRLAADMMRAAGGTPARLDACRRGSLFAGGPLTVMFLTRRAVSPGVFGVTDH